MVVGEAPGETEAAKGYPFCGKAGREQDAYLEKPGRDLCAKFWYRTNVVKEYREGNPDPAPSQIREWTPVLEQEIAEVQPKLIIAVGRFAARWFLGDKATNRMVHGIPHEAGMFDPARKSRAQGAVVLPVWHPAAGFYESDIRAVIDWDYGQIPGVLAKVRRDYEGPWAPYDEYEGNEHYEDVSGEELLNLLVDDCPNLIGLDTEGTSTDVSISIPWSIQVSWQPGVAYMVRAEREDFNDAIQALQLSANTGARFIFHHGMYDIEMCRKMGLELADADLWDLMYGAYLTRVQPQALKHLSYRLSGMLMDEYEDVVGDVGIDKQMDYLLEVANREWPKYDGRIVHENNGTSRWYKPMAIATIANKIINDYYGGKRNKDGERTDPWDRWKKADPVQKAWVTEELGPMPQGTLADIPLEEATWYSCRDADAAIRNYEPMQKMLREQGLSQLMEHGNQLLPIFEQMQYNGMPASRKHFEELHERMRREMFKIGKRISAKFCFGEPFNPASPDQTRVVMERLNIKGTKKTKTGKVSTSKKSLEHLRFTNEFIEMLFDWREHGKIRDSFCNPALDRIPEGEEFYPVRCEIKNTRVHTRRPAAANPNLLAIPIRHELGTEVRNGYQCPPGEVFGAWDVSQMEMRYMAHEAQDRLLIRRFLDKADIHAETAAEIFGIPLSQVGEKAHRYPAKRAGFGIITNITGAGLLDQLRMFGCKGWTEQKCDDLIKHWLEIYPGVAQYLKECKRDVRRTGEVRDYWGMPRYLPGVRSRDGKTRAESERAASSHKIQGGAQGMMQRSMYWLWTKLRPLQLAGLNIKWCLEVHDELIFQFDEDLWPTMNKLVVEALTDHGGRKLAVPMAADGAMHRTWGGAK